MMSEISSHFAKELLSLYQTFLMLFIPRRAAYHLLSCLSHWFCRPGGVSSPPFMTKFFL